MKKIFLAATAILIVGLFVGCASKPVQKNSKSVQRTPSGRQDLSKIKNMSEEELLQARLNRDLELVKAIVYAPVVTDDDVYKANKYSFYSETERLKELRKGFSTKTTRKDFSGKITNTTNQEAHLKICPRYSYKAIGKNLPDVDITIPPHETIYYIVENFFALGQDKFFIADLNNPNYTVYTYNSEGKDDEYHFFPIYSELFKTHSLETIYNPADLNNHFCTYNFIEPLDEKIKNEKNLIIIHQAENN